MQKRLSKIFTLSIITLLCLVGFLFVNLTSKNADAETVVKTNTVSFTDDFDLGAKKLSETNIYKYDHVIAPSDGSSTNGLMPGSAWESYIDFGDGYIMYKISPSANKELTDLVITFNTFLGYEGGIANYYNNTDVKIYVSDNEDNFGTAVFSLAKAKAGEGFTVVKDSTGEEVYGFNSYSANLTVSGSLTKYLNPTTDNYVKIALEHLTVTEIHDIYKAKVDGNGQQTYPNGYPNQNAEGNIPMGLCGIHMHNLTMTYTEARPTKLTSISYDMTANDGKSAANLGFYEYDHVYKPTSGHGFGLIPSTNWAGAKTCSNLGDGFFTYKLSPDKNYTFDSVDLDLNIQYNHKSMTLAASNKTNFNIYVSDDNATWTKVFSMYYASQYPDFVVTKIDTGAVFTGGTAGDGNQWTHTYYYNIKGDITKYFVSDKDNYVKFEMVQVDYEELNAWSMAKDNSGITIGERYGQGSVAYDDEKTVQLGRVNVTVTSLNINAYQVKSNVSSGSALYDYREYEKGSTEWTQDAFAMSGLQIVGPLTGSFVDENGAYYSTNALSSYGKSEGYVIYKFQAPEGYAFGTGDATLLARLFDYSMQDAGEKVQLWYSYDNEDYNLLYNFEITDNHKSSITSINFDEFVYGESVVFIKLVIGNSSIYPDWTCVGSLAIDLTYQAQQITVDFGNGYTEKYTVVKGEKFNTSLVNSIPQGFVREGAELYTNADCTIVFDANTIIAADTTLYVKGVWDKYQISYVLNGGVNASNNPTTYVAGVGANLYAPTYEGYVFVGWYLDSNFENYIDVIPVGRTGDITLYAKWEADVVIDLVYDVLYVLNGGVNNTSNPDYYRTNEGATLYEPYFEGYSFDGWYLDASFENHISSIEVGTIGNITLYAKWTPNTTGPGYTPDVPPVVEKPEDGEGDMTSASVTIGTDLSMKYEAVVGENDSVAMIITMNGKQVVVSGDTEDGTVYSFNFQNIAPHLMGENISAQLVINNEVKDEVAEYSVYQNLVNTFNRATTDELKTLVADTLNYGAMAQAYKNHNVDNFVNANAEIAAFATNFEPITESDFANVTENEVEGYTITGAGVFFDYVNNVYVKFTAGADYKVTVSVDGGEETEVSTIKYDGKVYRAYSPDISALGFDRVYTFKLYSGETLVQTVNYSVKTFVYNKQNGEDATANLAKALYNYGLATVAYKASK